MTEKKEDPIRLFILSSLRDGQAMAPHELARAFHATRAKPSDGPNAWRRYMNAVKQQTVSMARSEKLVFVRKGEPIHPDDVKGVYRVRLPLPGEEMPQPKPRDEDDDFDFDDEE